MKIVFFGTSAFGIPTLEALKKSPHQILSVVTTLDKPQGRNLKLKASPVKDWAERNDLPYLEVSRKSIPRLTATLHDLTADLFVVVSFGLILPKDLIETPKLMTLNIHPSLLPKYRGAAPVHWALMNGDTETGVTVMRIVERLDAGDILFQEKTKILPEDDIVSLDSRLSQLGAQALLRCLQALEKQSATFTPQEENLSNVARKIAKEDGHLAWNRPAAQITNWVRALKNWPKCYNFYEGKRLIILEAEVTSEENKDRFSPGAIVHASPGGGVVVAAQDRWVRLKTLQLEGKKPLPVHEFLKGFTIHAGQTLE